MRRLRVPVLVLLTLLAAPWSAAAEPADFLSRLLRLLPGLWEKAGCLIDPSGQCVPVSPDAGCLIDPDGECISDK
ncbi:MAG TPA: hypothetical protein VF414_05365 [Thermoanaerobaculia bacterium]